MKYGYLRVSTDKQNYERQLFVLQEHNLDKIFEETISGTKKACGREQFELLLNEIQKGDEVYFESMSRMARSMQDLIDTTNLIVKQKKAKVIFIKENLTIGGENGLDAMGGLIFNIMGAFAQFERDLTSDRTKQALAAKKANGQKLGAPQKVSDEQRAEIKELRKSHTCREIAEMYGVDASTISRIK
jgi:DNA invertase Pin-like site-specific DNA recombinase